MTKFHNLSCHAINEPPQLLDGYYVSVCQQFVHTLKLQENCVISIFEKESTSTTFRFFTGRLLAERDTIFYSFTPIYPKGNEGDETFERWLLLISFVIFISSANKLRVCVTEYSDMRILQFCLLCGQKQLYELLTKHY